MVKPDGGPGGEELRLSAGLQPLRLRLDQNVVDFLLGFAAPPVGLSFEDGELVRHEDALDFEWGPPPSQEPKVESAHPSNTCYISFASCAFLCQ